MRLGPILAAAACATLAAACSKPQTAQPSAGEPAATESAAPAPAPAPAAHPEVSDADKQKLLASLPAPYSAADLSNGEAKFALCRSCHTLTPGGANMTGPNLDGVFGRKSASNPSFKYSDALKAANWTWDAQHLDEWLAKPQTFLPGTKMTFAGLKNEKDRTDLIAYLMVETGHKPQ